MVDATTPEGAVEQGLPSEESLTSILDGAFGGDTPAPKAKQEQPEQPEEVEAADQESDEPTPDDLPDDEEAAPQSAPPGDEFEIVHNGETRKLSRAETIKLAQQGFDYTQKTQRVAEQQKQAEAVLQRAAEVEQLMPQVAQELAIVKSFEQQLSAYANVDWVRLATDDPLEYPRHRAQYDQLVQGYQSANGQLQAKVGYVSQQRHALTAQKLQQEGERLKERVPEWRDPVRYKAEAQELHQYLVKSGADPVQVEQLSDSLAVAIARKAMLYDKLVSAKAEKVKQVRAAPPVVRPGANAQVDQGRQNFAKVRTEIVKAGRAGKSASQEQMMIGLLNKTFKK